jgi:hypothetical protein
MFQATPAKDLSREPQKELKEPLIQTQSSSKIQPGSLLANETVPLGALIEKPRKKKSSSHRKEKDKLDKVDKEKRKKKPSKPKPLIDLSTATHCRHCNCTEFVQYPKRDACPYCYHVHLPSTTT